MIVKEIGEFGLIDRIAKMLPGYPPDVVVGIGDDVAVLKTSGDDYLLATCDMQMEGVHFTRGSISAFQLGSRAVAINVSDIAAMGGKPSWLLVSLAIPETTEVSFIDDLYRGFREQAAKAGAAIVGGNLSRSDSGIVIDITLLGQIAPELLLLRSGARPGDSILVTGNPGESRAGLELVRRPALEIGDTMRKSALERHLTPQPRLREGQVLALSGMVHAMADVSDGLLADLGHICDASRTGAVIEADKLPVSELVAHISSASDSIALDWVLAGGEDYELLFTADKKSVPDIRQLLREQTGTICHEIGTITAETGKVRLSSADGRVSVKTGWDHFMDR